MSFSRLTLLQRMYSYRHSLFTLLGYLLAHPGAYAQTSLSSCAMAFPTGSSGSDEVRCERQPVRAFHPLYAFFLPPFFTLVVHCLSRDLLCFRGPVSVEQCEAIQLARHHGTRLRPSGQLALDYVYPARAIPQRVSLPSQPIEIFGAALTTRNGQPPSDAVHNPRRPLRSQADLLSSAALARAHRHPRNEREPYSAIRR